MRVIVQICNEHALEEFVYLTDSTATVAKNRDIRLPKERFRLISDVVIALNISYKGIAVVEENSNVCCHIADRSKSYESTFTKDIMLSLKTRDQEDLDMYLFFESETVMCFYKTERSRVISLGSGLDQDICCIDSDKLSNAHILFRSSGAKDIINIKGKEGCYINGRFVSCMTSAEIRYGDVIVAGDIKLLWLKEHLGISRYTVNRPIIVRLMPLDRPEHMYISPATVRKKERTVPPRNVAALDRSGVKLDAPPQKREIKRQKAYVLIGPALTMAIPMCLGSGLYIFFSRSSANGAATYMYTGIVTAIASAFLGAAWAWINIRNASKEERQEEELRVRSYTGYIESCDKQIRDKYRYNTNALKRNDPSLKDMFSSVFVSVFNRRRKDEELFKYRIGTGSLPLELKIEVPEEKFMVVPDELAELPQILKKKYSMLHDVPVCVDIYKDRLIGFISADVKEMVQLFLNISLQIAATTGPDIIRMVYLIFDPSPYGDILKLFAFLPQVMGDDEHYVCVDKERAREFLCSFETIVRGMEGKGLRWIVFTDDPREIPISIAKRDDISLLVFGREYDILPCECTLIVQNDETYRGVVSIGERDGRRDVDFDRIGTDDAERFIRSIAGMKVRTEVLRGMIPHKVSVPDIFDVEDITCSFIRSNWERNDTRNSLMAPIGRGADERNIYLDIHEKAHGPHGLIAGMTGSGKSEMLATFILSLAIRYSPYEIGFLLIDYKGGGMAGLFKDLPHLRGSISNLSGNMISRAMVSIRSENVRRQKLFLKAGVNSVTEYGRLYRGGKVSEPLPHLIIIIDEFAELKQNEPDFMKELISVAQVGRSLGVHLILATQKPAGTVDDNIFSNSRFRICLRVQDKQDSNDMLHRPDASYIKEPGRAFLQVGNDELFEEFQAGYAMEPYRDERAGSGRVFAVDEFGHRKEVLSESEKHYADEELRAGEETHFSVILKRLGECKDAMDNTSLKDLWLPPLGDTVILDEIDVQKGKYEIIIGMYDEPASQTQGIYEMNLFDTGNLVICGSSLSGKSTILQTILYGYIKNCSPADINIYIIDFSNCILSCLRDSKNVGGYMTEEDTDKMNNLFYMLEDIMKIRRKNADIPRIPILLVIDNYGRFREKTECIYDKQMMELVKFGEAIGIYAILSAGAIGSNDVPARLFENCRSGICLRMNDKYQYSECLRQIRLPIFPDDLRGRGLARIDGKILEFQTAVCCKGSDRKREETIKERIEALNLKYEDMCAPKVPYIPQDPTIQDLEESLDGIKAGGVPIGYEAVTGKPLYIREAKRSCILFAGKKGSGRSNAVKVYEFFAKKIGYSVEHAGSISDFVKLAEYKKDSVIVLENAGEAIAAFYTAGHDKETEEKFIRLMDENMGLRYVFTMTDDDYVKVAGLRAYERILEDCYGIYFGGGLDKQSIFDYSYLSYGELCMKKHRGRGTILKRHDHDYSGDVVVPAA